MFNYNNNYLSLRNFAAIIKNKHNHEIVNTKPNQTFL